MKKEISTELKAAFLCGLYTGSLFSKSHKAKKFRKEAKPHVDIAALITFDKGAFNPLQIWEMEAFYDSLLEYDYQLN